MGDKIALLAELDWWKMRRGAPMKTEAELDELEHSLDPGIALAVRILVTNGVETFESCQGGQGHCFPEPTVRFHGHRDMGLHALGVALANGLPVSALRRVWDMIDGEPVGPHWEMTFSRTMEVDNAGA